VTIIATEIFSSEIIHLLIYGKIMMTELSSSEGNDTPVRTEFPTAELDELSLSRSKSPLPPTSKDTH